MEKKTRDNLIYLTVSISLAALIVADVYYSLSHGREIWMPSRFAFRTTATTGLLAFFVARETLKARATLAHVLASVFFATFLHLGIAYSLRQMIGQLSGLLFSALVVMEMFIVLQLTVRIDRYLRSGS